MPSRLFALSALLWVVSANYKASSPGFSEKACSAMGATRLKLGSPVPPNDYVTGCDEVCDAARAIKEYWGSGEMAEYACGIVKSFGCVYAGTPPVTDIGC